MKPSTQILRSRPRARAGFTLIELMVSLAVLVLLVLMVLGLLNNATTVTGLGVERMDADAQARLVFDRMAFDFSRIVKRADVDYVFQKNTGNDQMTFYSESTGYYPTGVTGTAPKSNVSLVGYRVRNNQLERLGKGLVWNGVTASSPGVSSLSPATDRPMAFLPQKIADVWPTAVGTTDDADYQVISNDVFRLEFCFVLKGSGAAATLSDTPWKAPNTAPEGLQDVSAVVVTLALLDSRSRAKSTDGVISSAAAKLGDFAGTVPPAGDWQTKIQTDGLGLPALAQRVRVYQRYFYLNPSR